MKVIAITFLGLMLSLAANAQSRSVCDIFGAVYEEKEAYRADYRVYIEEDEYSADLIVFKEDNELMADKTGLWYFVKYRNFATFTVCFVKERGQANFTVYFTEIDAEARCNR